MQKHEVEGRDDPFDLHRFVAAQEGIYAHALSELRDGRKRSHWMWYIFPQIDGLGHSSTTQYYAIKSLEEALAYLAHPVLGKRLLECSEAVYSVQGRGASEIFGYPDDLKFHSSMTLFAQIGGADSVFVKLLDKYYRGATDGRTPALIRHSGPRA